MKKFLFSLSCMATLGMLFSLVAQASERQQCYYPKQYQTFRAPGYHPNAYDDGYREGTETARRGEAYQPRSSGGEFGRGFQEGYYHQPYTGQRNIVRDRRQAYATMQCRTFSE